MMYLRFISKLCFEFIKFFLTLFFYPIAYYFRVWAWEYHPSSRLAKLLWFFLDDTPEWSDAGGTWFYRNVCNYNNGVKPESYGSRKNYGLETERYIHNPWRRFCCSYRWAIRNPLTNYTEYSALGSSVDRMDYIYDSRRIPISSKIKTEDGIILLDKSFCGTYITKLTETNGKTHLRIDTAGLKRIPFTKKYIAWDIWIGYSGNRPHKFEAAFRPFIWKDVR